VMRRRLPKDFGGGVVLVSPECGLKYWKPGVASAEPWLLEMCRQLVGEGQSVWDIGANLGLFALAAAGLAGKSGFVLAVEPDPWLVQIIRKSSLINQNGFGPVSVLGAAAAEVTGVANFHIASRARASSFLEGAGSTQAGGTREICCVPTFTLDLLMSYFRPPDVVKIDVEGAEELVLRGAGQLLQRVRPVILCEVSAERSAVVSEILRENRYKLFDAEKPPSQRPPLERACWNTLAIPE